MRNSRIAWGEETKLTRGVWQRESAIIRTRGSLSLFRRVSFPTFAFRGVVQGLPKIAWKNAASVRRTL
jgi:hypothetical protein